MHEVLFEYEYAILFLLGGTIGLFCGLSLISVIEVIFWVYKTIVKYLSP